MLSETLANLRKKDREEGRQEGKLEIVETLLSKNFSLETIQEITKLTLDQIKSYAEEKGFVNITKNVDMA